MNRLNVNPTLSKIIVYVCTGSYTMLYAYKNVLKMKFRNNVKLKIIKLKFDFHLSKIKKLNNIKIK